jgi:hypothetical protein
MSPLNKESGRELVLLNAEQQRVNRISCDVMRVSRAIK